MLGDMTDADMLHKDKIFKSIMRRLKSEISSFEDLRIIPTDLYETIIDPLLTHCCNEFLSGEDVFYSFRKESTSFDKLISIVVMTIGLYIADSFDFKFKYYQIILTFGGTGK